MLWKNTNANQLSSPLDNTIIMALSALSARGSLTASHQRDSPRWSVNPRERVVAMAGTISRPAGLHTHSFNFSLSSPARCPLCPPLPAAWPFFTANSPQKCYTHHLSTPEAKESPFPRQCLHACPPQDLRAGLHLWLPVRLNVARTLAISWTSSSME